VIDRRIFEAAQRFNALYPPEFIASLTRLQEISRRFGGWQPAPSVEPVKPPWSRDSDPNTPEGFKEFCRRSRIDQHQFLILELTPEIYSIELCVICEYHKLAKTYYENGLGKVPQEKLEEKVSAIHKKFKGAPPSQRLLRQTFKDLGLDLPHPGRGRPSEKRTKNA
jgi:hypothetical protein